MSPNSQRDLKKAALRGEPSYLWRDGQVRRLELVAHYARQRIHGAVLDNGCGVGSYVEHLRPYGGTVHGLEYEPQHAAESAARNPNIIRAAGEHLPYPANSFDLILSNEVLEHVQDDQAAIRQMVRALKPGGRLVLFCPNRWHPFETHGMYWRGQYRFGDIFALNYLPRAWRDQFAPHVNVYTRRDLERLFAGLPVRFIYRSVHWRAWDNIIRRWPRLGRFVRAVFYALEKTPLNFLGLSHVWIVEKTGN
jgi:SAM-dependent methyltransferase